MDTRDTKRFGRLSPIYAVVDAPTYSKPETRDPRTRDTKSETRDTKPETRDTEPETQEPRHETRDPGHETRNPRHKARNSQLRTPNLKPATPKSDSRRNQGVSSPHTHTIAVTLKHDNDGNAGGGMCVMHGVLRPLTVSHTPACKPV